MEDDTSDIMTLPAAPLRSDAERLRIITETIEQLRAGLQADGGDMALVAVEGDKVRIKLSGACVSCTMAGQTLGGVRRQLMRQLGEPVRVVPAA